MNAGSINRIIVNRLVLNSKTYADDDMYVCRDVPDDSFQNVNSYAVVTSSISYRGIMMTGCFDVVSGRFVRIIALLMRTVWNNSSLSLVCCSVPVEE